MNNLFRILTFVITLCVAGNSFAQTRWGDGSSGSGGGSSTRPSGGGGTSSRLDTLEMQIQNLQAQVNAIPRGTPNAATRDEVDVLRKDVAALRQEMTEIRREYQQLNKKIDELIDIAKKGGGGGRTPPPTNTSTSGETQRGYEHVVEQGQTLSDIALAYKVKVDAILKANPNVEPTKLKIGQKLFIPAQ